MSKTYMSKIKIYLNQSYREDTKGYVLDNSNAMYFSDGYSIIKLFDTTYTRKQRNDILNELNEIKTLKTSILNMFNKFQESEFNIQSKVISTQKDKFNSKQYIMFENNTLMFDYTKILKIARIIGKNEEVSFYTSDKYKDAICMVGRYGVAFLLGCKTF